MNEIEIPYHLIIPTLISLTVLTIIIIRRKKLFGQGNRKWIWISLTVFIVVYLGILSYSTYKDIYYQWDLNKYDINKDGFFSGSEITENQKNAMFKLTNDVGRNFSYITGLIFAFTVSFPVFIIGLLNNLIKK